MRVRALAGLVALALGGCAAGRADTGDSDAAELAETLAGRTAGTPQRCIDASWANGPQIVGENLIYRDGRRLFVTRAVDTCPSLRGDPIVIVDVYGGQLCTNDRFRTVERGGIGIPSPDCRFGPFVPYTAPK